MKTRLTKYPLSLIACLFTILFLSCAVPTKQPSYFDKHPNVLKKSYTADEIARIEQGFKANPLQYSQAVGNMLLYKMHQKSPEFALEFAQTPEIADGIDAQEVKAMGSIYDLVKGMDISPNLFVKYENEQDVQKILIEWEGGSEKQSKWNGFLPLLGRSIGGRFLHRLGKNAEGPFLGKLIDVKPVGFEAGEDKINYEELKNGILSWESSSSLADKDGLIVTLEYPHNDKLDLVISDQDIEYFKNQMLYKSIKGGKLLIKNPSGANFTKQQNAMRNMVLSGEGEHKYSALLEALLWGYMDGKFKKGDNPLKDYKGVVEFVKPIWGEMDGAKWKDFDAVTSRLNTPEFVDHYTKKKFTYFLFKSNAGSARNSFNQKKDLNCDGYEKFINYCLVKGGYKTERLDVDHGYGWHVVTEFQDNGKRFIIDNGAPFFPRGIIGPFKSLQDAGYNLFGVPIHWNK